MRLLSLLLILVLIVPMLVVAQKPSSPTSSDDRIYDDVRRKLADDANVRGAGLAVTVKDGAVTLEGRVHDDKAREKAARITKRVKGVTNVTNKLKLFSET
ncbi:MAG: BON domain-containing protein [Bryobacterales bacterium]|nr:BON domain-containing protein [Bryobacterales bacterium]